MADKTQITMTILNSHNAEPEEIAPESIRLAKRPPMIRLPPSQNAA